VRAVSRVAWAKAFNRAEVSIALIERAPIWIAGTDADAVDDIDVVRSASVMIRRRAVIAAGNFGNAISITVSGHHRFHGVQHAGMQPDTGGADVRIITGFGRLAVGRVDNICPRSRLIIRNAGRMRSIQSDGRVIANPYSGCLSSRLRKCIGT
jgi:hypothetical protein